MADLPSLQPRKPGRVGLGLGLNLMRVEVLPALRESRPALGFQSQLGPQIPELARMSTLPHAGAEDDVHSASVAKGTSFGRSPAPELRSWQRLLKGPLRRSGGALERAVAKTAKNWCGASETDHHSVCVCACLCLYMYLCACACVCVPCVSVSVCVCF